MKVCNWVTYTDVSRAEFEIDKAAEVARPNTLFDRHMNNAIEDDQTKHSTMLGQAKTEYEVNAVQAFLMKAESQYPTKGAVVELGAQAKYRPSRPRPTRQG